MYMYFLLLSSSMQGAIREDNDTCIQYYNEFIIYQFIVNVFVHVCVCVYRRGGLMSKGRKEDERES